MFEKYGILQIGDERLRKVCEPITGKMPVREIDAIVRRLLKAHQSLRTCGILKKHVSLAAPQLGIMHRAIIVSTNLTDAAVMLNPTILLKSREQADAFESCLSIWHFRARVRRPISIRLKYLDIYGNTKFQNCAGLLARIVQHEIDHLDGVLFIDRVNPDGERVPLTRYCKKLLVSHLE